MTLSQAFAVLGIDETTNPADIKRRFRELIQRSHPDKPGSSQPDKAADIIAAYRTISTFHVTPPPSGYGYRSASAPAQEPKRHWATREWYVDVALMGKEDAVRSRLIGFDIRIIVAGALLVAAKALWSPAPLSSITDLAHISAWVLILAACAFFAHAVRSAFTIFAILRFKAVFKQASMVRQPPIASHIAVIAATIAAVFAAINHISAR